MFPFKVSCPLSQHRIQASSSSSSSSIHPSLSPSLHLPCASAAECPSTDSVMFSSGACIQVPVPASGLALSSQRCVCQRCTSGSDRYPGECGLAAALIHSWIGSKKSSSSKSSSDRRLTSHHFSSLFFSSLLITSSLLIS